MTWKCQYPQPTAWAVRPSPVGTSRAPGSALPSRLSTVDVPGASDCDIAVVEPGAFNAAGAGEHDAALRLAVMSSR